MQTRSSTARIEPSVAVTADRRIHGPWVRAAAALWLAVAVLAVGCFAAGLPLEFERMRDVCTVGPCTQHPGLTPEIVQQLQVLGLSPSAFAAYFVLLDLLFAVVWVLVGATLFRRAPDHVMAVLASLMLVTTGPSFALAPAALAPVWPLWWLAATTLQFIGTATLGLFLALFPDARFRPPWTRWLALAWVVLQALETFLAGVLASLPFWPTIDAIATWALSLALLLLQVRRYRRVSDALQRQQARWVISGIALALLGFFGVVLLGPLLLPLGLAVELLGNTAIYASMLLIPLAIAVAVQRERLWDIDPLISRALVYAALTISLLALYTLVVVGLGTLLSAEGSPGLALLATGVVAVLFAPLRHRLQHGVNRLLYGERDDPYAVLSRLGQRLEATLAPDALLPAVVETTREALRLPYAAIALDRDGALEIVAASGAPPGRIHHLPLRYQHEALGELQVGARGVAETFSAADQRLLADLARQAGIAAHAVRLHTQTARLAADVQQARERLITAREEERRRLRRDLHDGLGPQLASLTLKLEVARDAVRSQPDLAEHMIDGVMAKTEAAVADIRGLVYALRPPALDELGLIGALREHIAQHTPPGLSVVFDAPERPPPLPAAVEVAAYRIAQEAFTNVVQHAYARQCVVRLAIAAGRLDLTISDDGRGLPEQRRAGVGLRSMRERAAELGGACAIVAGVDAGTRVSVCLPYTAADPAQ